MLWDLAHQAGHLASVLELPNGQRLRLVPVESGTLEKGFSLVFTPALAHERAADAMDTSTVTRDTLSPLERAEYDSILETMRRFGGNKVDGCDRPPDLTPHAV